jgi:hypothetical protein
MVVVDPCTFPERLRKAGFDEVQVDVLKPYAFRFRARKATVTFPARDEVLGRVVGNPEVKTTQIVIAGPECGHSI